VQGILYAPGPGTCLDVEKSMPLISLPITAVGGLLSFILGLYCPGPGDPLVELVPAVLGRIV
jgi:hypothetical protein